SRLAGRDVARNAVHGALERIRALRAVTDPADPRAALHQRARRQGDLLLRWQPARADRSGPRAREAATGSARGGRVRTPRADRAARCGGALPSFLAPRRHAHRHAAAANAAGVANLATVPLTA